MKKVLVLWAAYIALFCASAAAQSIVMPNSYRQPKVLLKSTDGEWKELETKTTWTAGRSATNPVMVTLPEDVKQTDLIKVSLTVRNKEFHIMVLNTAVWFNDTYMNFKPVNTFHVGPLNVYHKEVTFKVGDACATANCRMDEGFTAFFYLYEKADYYGTPYVPRSQVGAHYKFSK